MVPVLSSSAAASAYLARTARRYLVQGWDGTAWRDVQLWPQPGCVEDCHLATLPGLCSLFSQLSGSMPYATRPYRVWAVGPHKPHPLAMTVMYQVPPPSGPPAGSSLLLGIPAASPMQWVTYLLPMGHC